MRRAVRAIVIHDNKLLTIHRNKFGQEYDTLPGGGVDPGESLEQALVREMHEETSVEISQPRLVFTEDAGSMFGVQYVFLCKYAGGEPALHPASEEALINKLGKNTYAPRWIPVEELPTMPFVSPRLKQQILTSVANGFPETVKEIAG